MKKRNLLYFGIIGLSFLWTGSAYMSNIYRLFMFCTPAQINIYGEIIFYLMQVLGLGLFAAGLKFLPKLVLRRSFFAAVLIAEAVIIPLSFIPTSDHLVLIMGYFMNVLHGFVAAYYLTQLSTLVPQQYRGRVFGFGYAVGSVGTWLLSLLFNGSFLQMKSAAIFYLFMIAGTLLLLWFSETPQADKEQAPAYGVINIRTILMIFAVVVLLTLTKTLGFYFPAQDVSATINIEYSRAFYAIGLIAAGFINDFKRKYGAICCLVALVFPFVSIALKSQVGLTAATWILGYIFFGFFSVYRVLVFSDIGAKKSTFLFFAPLGLLAGRIGDALGTFAGMQLSSGILSLVLGAGVCFVLVVLLFLPLYQKLYVPLLSESENRTRLYESFEARHALSRREADVFRLLIQGYSNLEISGTLYVSESTVKFHVGNILKKTGSTNRTELATLFKQIH